MSIENAKAFYEKVKADRELQQKIGELAKNKPVAMEAVILQVAEENGFRFTLEEMRAFIKELAERVPKSGELSDDQLEAVAGGDKLNWIGLSVGGFGFTCLLSLASRSNFGCPADKY